MRGVWVDAFGHGLREPAEIVEVVDFAAAAGLDTLVVQATRRGDAFATRLSLPRADADLAETPFDPLDEVCARAHGAGLAVHAWISVTPAGNGAEPPPAVADWLSSRYDDARRDRHGIWHLDPGVPDARRLVAGIASALAAEYPVDGVSLDRVRYPESARSGAADWGYNPTALLRYAEQTGASSRPSPDEAGWQSWRRAQVTALVAEVAAAVRDARGDAVVSVNGCCFGGLEGGWEASRPYTETAQDWVGWLRDGLVDRVLAMNYRGDADDADLVDQPPVGADLTEPGAAAEHADPRRLRERFDAWARLAVSAGGQGAVLGSGWYLHPVADNAAEVAHAERLTSDGRAAGGWCGFSYRTPSRAVLRGRAEAGDERAALAPMLRRG